MSTPNLERAAIDLVLEVLAPDPKTYPPNQGICNLVAIAIAAQTKAIHEVLALETGTLLLKAFREWPEFSGDAAWPVPAPWHSDKSEGLAYVSARNKGTMWSRWTAYGRSRRRLRKFLISHFTTLRELDNDL